MACTIALLREDQLDDARRVLEVACPFDRAAEVAAEKLFGPAPSGPAVAWGAWDGGRLLGVAAASGTRLRLLAVTPEARGAGVGSALHDVVEAWARAGLVPTLRTLDLPGNYLAPGIDERNAEAIAWLGRRGWVRHGDNTNLIVALRDNPQVSAARRDALIAQVTALGYEVRRARRAETVGLTAAIRSEFGGAWPFEVERALASDGVHLALRDGGYAAFAAHDGNNAGLGWFGPAGTWPGHRGRGLGEAVLLACLVDLAPAHDVCEVAWIGPRAFYERSAGVTGERRFAVLIKELETK